MGAGPRRFRWVKRTEYLGTKAPGLELGMAEAVVCGFF